VCELYQQLHHAGNPELLETYESVILGILKDIRQQQVENDRLEKSFKRYEYEVLLSKISFTS
jgi:hypothetical protein